MIRINATAILGRDLRPGDLFSTAGPEYWDGFPTFPSIAERVYIRTASPATQSPDADEEVYRIEIEELLSDG
jgi:hypothetical protein